MRVVWASLLSHKEAQNDAKTAKRAKPRPAQVNNQTSETAIDLCAW
jgi:hypothetical protein